ncbi:MAG TPA: glycosyltransferase family 1 protein [Ktedonobacterales bacterium]|nr:glycosyltransferase family 1 protein [Ktedonobacterales bacterium]
MRVALVTENFLPKLDGVTRTLAMLLEHLQRHGHKAIVLGPEGALRAYAGARIFGAPGFPIPFYPELRVLFPAPRLERRLARFRPDIVHVVDPMLLGAAGIAWGRQLGAPVLSTYHTNLAEYCTYFHLSALVAPMWSYRRFLHNQCALTLCPSPSTSTQLLKHGFSRVGVWARGVDGESFRPERRSQAWRKRITHDPTIPIILYVGRLSYEKNLDDLVKAFRMLDDCSAHLVLVGDGPARADIKRALQGRRVTFTGYLKGEALTEAYASADMFAFPSVTETFGQVVMEAMASGLPVVAYDAEGVRDSVRHGETGLLTPARDSLALAEGLRTLLAEPERRRMMGAAAHAYASQRNWSDMLDQLLATYQRVIARQKDDTQADAIPDAEGAA